ncbi:YdiK family protein [Halobacillus sp. A5]|uniref:YdiK family protein n=1 Tax=Halobacillus sp. A5 TaxID=2880263 RepID=UPI0020A628E9|nr:YdiK family protein [Halobacillus sp. A5]MCP3028816.1 YdiK family protein [Halobacillus sp. A5]
MRASPLTMAAIYFFMGVAFTYIAASMESETVWDFTTLLPAVIATFNFAVTIRLINIHLKIKQKKNENKK